MLGHVLIRVAAAVAVFVAADASRAEPQSPAATFPTDKEIIDNPIDRPGFSYPQAAYEAGIEGVVTLRIVIGADGIVKEATVVKADPPGWFEEAAVTGIKRWRYKPPGREVISTIVVEFKIPPQMKLPAQGN